MPWIFSDTLGKWEHFPGPDEPAVPPTPAQEPPQVPPIPQADYHVGSGWHITSAQFEEAIAHMGVARKRSKMKFEEVKEEEEENEMNTYIYPYNNASRGARALSKALGVPILKRGGTIPSRLLDEKTSRNCTIINWGAANGYDLPLKRVINGYREVNKCGNKLTFFNTVKDTVRIPEYTTDLSEALEWGNAGKEVLGRSTRGSCGRDIKFFSEDFENFAKSEFFVLYKKKRGEYRVHVTFGDVVAIQQKAARTTDPEGKPIDLNDLDYRIRNLANGFVFKRMDIEVPADVVEQARLAISTIGLDFGAVDVIYNQMEGKAYVLEVNTAPGLEGTTIDDYANVFRERLAA